MLWRVLQNDVDILLHHKLIYELHKEMKITMLISIDRFLDKFFKEYHLDFETQLKFEYYHIWNKESKIFKKFVELYIRTKYRVDVLNDFCKYFKEIYNLR